MFLPDDTFRTVIAATPLVSIDLVVRNAAGEVLLGRRCNRPAKDFWFVPGGRVRKNEPLDAAFFRLCQAELGVVFRRDQAHFLGVYQHFYHDSVFGDVPDTHYVVLAYQLSLDEGACQALPQEQHNAYRWWAVADMLASADVHDYTRDYFGSVEA